MRIRKLTSRRRKYRTSRSLGRGTTATTGTAGA